MNYKKIIYLIFIMLFFSGVSHAEHHGYIVKFKTVPTDINTSVFEEINAESGLYAIDDTTAITGYEEYIEYVEENEVVELDLPNTQVKTRMLPDDDMYAEQWSLPLIKAEYAWEHGFYGNEIRVGVIDSGCYPHNDLKDNLLEGKNFLTNTTNTLDNMGHGTHVTGIIASSMNSEGIVGVAPQAKIVPLKCFDTNVSTSIATIARAILSATDDFGCKVINMSFGVPSNSSTLRFAIDSAYSKGTILVSSVGNDGKSTLYYPAAYDNVIGVASVSSNKTKSYFSQYNSSVYITAPGDKIKSTSYSNSYVYMSGTSQAAPHISGIAALVLSVDSSITPDRFSELLSETAEDLGDEGYDTSYGYGLVDVSAIIDKLTKPTVIVNEFHLGDYPAKAWDILIKSYDSSKAYAGKFIDGDESKEITLHGISKAESGGDVSFAILLDTSRKQVELLLDAN